MTHTSKHNSSKDHEAKHRFKVCVEDQLLPWPGSTITTEEIAELGGWDPKLGVLLIDSDNNERPLEQGEEIELKPGIGFAKDDPGNLQLLSALPDLAALGFPVVIGPSRKSFIGRLTGAALDRRLPGTLAALIPAVALDRVVVRVHEPAPARQFLEIAARINEAAA